MRFVFLIILIVWVAQNSKAQDTIRRTDGVLIPAEIIEIRTGEIFFNKTEDVDKRVYIISTEDVEWVRYANGTQRLFTTSTPSQSKQFVTSPPIRNIIALRPFDLLFPVLSFTYERVSPSQKFSYRIPVSFGLNNRQVRYPSSAFIYAAGRSFSTGIELNFYLGTPDRFRYFIGPAFHLGFLRFASEYYPASTPATRYVYKGTQYAVLINNGFWFQVADRVVLGVDAGLGLRRRSYKDNTTIYSYYPAEVSLKLSGNVSIGFTF